VVETLWNGTGPVFTLFWGGRDWTLNVEDPRNGLRLQTGESLPRLLAPDRLAAPKRCDRDAFTRKTLVAFERYRSSVQATYAPRSWGGIQVRAAWTARAQHDTLDLEIQLSASSVGELDGLEVGVTSRLDPAAPEDSEAPRFYVEARDAAAAFAVGDGREPDVHLCGFAILSDDRPLRPSLHPPRDTPSAGAASSAPGLFYAEMAHPDDLFRRVFTEPIPAESLTVPGGSIRYALFGLELEKGVILRARLRGQWLRSANPQEEAAALYQEFLRQPPPLGP
jgi:hypothetical protein